MWGWWSFNIITLKAERLKDECSCYLLKHFKHSFNPFLANILHLNCCFIPPFHDNILQPVYAVSECPIFVVKNWRFIVTELYRETMIVSYVWLPPRKKLNRQIIVFLTIYNFASYFFCPLIMNNISLFRQGLFCSVASIIYWLYKQRHF